MNHLYYILIFGVLLIVFSIVYYLSLKKRKKEDHPVKIRANEMMVMINQRIHSLNSRIQKLDSEITEIMLAEEKNDLSLTSLQISLEDIPIIIKDNKEKIRTFIADINDLKEYHAEIAQKIKEKEEAEIENLENLLDLAKEKLQYRFT